MLSNSFTELVKTISCYCDCSLSGSGLMCVRCAERSWNETDGVAVSAGESDKVGNVRRVIKGVVERVLETMIERGTENVMLTHSGC